MTGGKRLLQDVYGSRHNWPLKGKKVLMVDEYQRFNNFISFTPGKLLMSTLSGLSGHNSGISFSRRFNFDTVNEDLNDFRVMCDSGQNGKGGRQHGAPLLPPLPIVA